VKETHAGLRCSRAVAWFGRVQNPGRRGLRGDAQFKNLVNIPGFSKTAIAPPTNGAVLTPPANYYGQAGAGVVVEHTPEGGVLLQQEVATVVVGLLKVEKQ